MTVVASGICNNAKGIRTLGSNINKDTGEVTTSLHVNPNVYSGGDDYYIDTLKDFRAVMRDIHKQCICTPYSIQRIDFRIDNYRDQYSDYFKINKLVVLLLAKELGANNMFESKHPALLTPKTVRAQCGAYEVEYYDRYDKTARAGLARTRLELRNKNLRDCNIKDIPKHIKSWCITLTHAQSLYKDIQAEENNVLLNIWRESPHINITDFVRQHQDVIYTSTQLQALFSAIGVNNPQALAYDYAYKLDLEFICGTELTTYIKKLCKTLREFVKEPKEKRENKTL